MSNLIYKATGMPPKIAVGVTLAYGLICFVGMMSCSPTSDDGRTRLMETSEARHRQTIALESIAESLKEISGAEPKAKQ